MSVVKERNYESPESVIRGLIVRGFISSSVKGASYPLNSCGCRGCRLTRISYKLADLPIPTTADEVLLQSTR